MISILFARANSKYKNYCCNVYDAERNALNSKNGVVITHPPCRAWGRLRHLSNEVFGEKKLALWSILRVNRFGGVLEHPIGSGIWKKYRHLMRRGIIITINQSDLGHKCQKPTKLYIYGLTAFELPAHQLTNNAITHCIGASVEYRKRTGLLHASATMREATPPAMIEYLLKIAKKIQRKKISKNSSISYGQMDFVDATQPKVIN